MSTTKRSNWLIAGGLIAIAGVATFLYLRQRKGKKIVAVATTAEPTAEPTSPAPSGAGTVPPVPQYSFPFKTEAEGNRFRAWVNDNYPSYAKSIQLDRTGKLNSYVDKAWKTYGTQYTASVYSTGGVGAARAYKVTAAVPAGLSSTPLYPNLTNPMISNKAINGEYVGTTQKTIGRDSMGIAYYKVNFKDTGATRWIRVNDARLV